MQTANWNSLTCCLLSVCLSALAFLYLFSCLPDCLSVCLSVHLSVCARLFIFALLLAWLSVCLTISLSLSLCHSDLPSSTQRSQSLATAAYDLCKRRAVSEPRDTWLESSTRSLVHLWSICPTLIRDAVSKSTHPFISLDLLVISLHVTVISSLCVWRQICCADVSYSSRSSLPSCKTVSVCTCVGATVCVTSTSLLSVISNLTDIYHCKNNHQYKLKRLQSHGASQIFLLIPLYFHFHVFVRFFTFFETSTILTNSPVFI